MCEYTNMQLPFFCRREKNMLPVATHSAEPPVASHHTGLLEEWWWYHPTGQNNNVAESANCWVASQHRRMVSTWIAERAPATHRSMQGSPTAQKATTRSAKTHSLASSYPPCNAWGLPVNRCRRTAQPDTQGKPEVATARSAERPTVPSTCQEIRTDDCRCSTGGWCT